MSTIKKIILSVLGIIIVIPLFAFIAFRIWQPQMFETAVIDTVAPNLPATLGTQAVLVYSKTSGGFRHSWSIDAANNMIKKFAVDNHWQVFYTENAAVFNDAQLAHFAVVVWNNATGAALSDAQRLSFQQWLEAGGGYVGLHAAGDGSHADWDWYTDEVIMAPYNQHTLLPDHAPEASVHTENSAHPATAHLPKQWKRTEEWYAWHKNPRDAGATILVTVDESSYVPGAASMGDDHPVVWSHTIGKGRVFYSAFGHYAKAYEDNLLAAMMEQGITWAGRLEQPAGH